LKKMLPTLTAAVSGVAPPPVGPPVLPAVEPPPVPPPPVPLPPVPPPYGPPADPPPVEGAVGEYPEHPASTARATAISKRLTMRSPLLNVILVYAATV
jgi:hypothetical protein